MQLFPPEPGSGCAVYLPGSQENAAAIYDLLPSPKPALITVAVPDWNRDLSPWPAPAVFRDGDFSGGAQDYLRMLMGEIIPAAEAALPIAGLPRVLAGYSLAGLFAVWAAVQTDAFAAVASMSGSLWYDDFLPWLEAHIGNFHAAQAYFSLGDREPRTRNPRMARVGDCTQAAARLLEVHGVHTTFAWQPGNHFQQPELRIAAGVNWTMEQIQNLNKE